MIYNLKVNKMNNVFVNKDNIQFSFIATLENEFEFVLYSKEKEVYRRNVSLDEAIGFKVDYKFLEGQTYSFKIKSDVEESKLESFKIFDKLDANFISTSKELTHPVFFKDFEAKDIKEARLAITGLGFYVAFINGKRVGNDYLTPGLNDYDEYVRYQEYDVTNLLSNSNTLEVVLGDGMYKGRMGFDNHPGNIYGDTYLLCAKLILVDSNGNISEIKTDESFKAHASEFSFSTIYDGEVRDANADTSEIYDTFVVEDNHNLVCQFNPTIKSHELLKPELIITPSGEKVLDFKQNMVGFVRFINKTPKGTLIHLQYGEVLQQGNFYRENLRSAKAELLYTSNGIECEVNAMFTYYGFRYVKVEGIENIDVNDFTGVVLHTDLEETITCKTSNQLLNQLISNTKWGQKGNFLDVPTDCPQRDERLGWTGDTQVFAATACMNMLAENFYKKFIKDLRADQVRYYNGDIPCYCPSLKRSAREGGAVWADVATILPIKVYEAYGNKDLLIESYPLMKDYVDSLIKNDLNTGNTHLVNNGFTFGDWLAMDGATSQSRKGGTEDFYIQSFYYYNSLILMAKAANILGNENDEIYYNDQALLVKQAIIDEYFSKNGRLTIDTQAGYVLSLYYGIYINKEKVINAFKNRLTKDFFTMKSGFVGTPLMIQTLLDNNMEDFAYRMLFSEKCPGWFFSIKLGATTIWERWNSILEDGSISGTSMNSLNHYAYGSVCEAIYTRIAGLKNNGNAYKNITIEPHINYRLKEVDLTYKSVRGDIHIDYKINKDNTFNMNVVIPHGVKATIILPSKSKDNVVEVDSGTYSFNYMLEQDYNHPFTMFSSFIDILANKDATMACMKYPAFVGIASSDEEMAINSPFVFTMMGFLPVTLDQAKEIDVELRKVEA